MSDPSRPVNIVFVGAGAVGCFYASRLHHPDHNVNVSLTARSNYAVLARSGVKMLTHSFGDYTFVPAAVYPSVTAASPKSPSPTASTAAAAPPAEGWDYVIVTTKALPDRVDDAATIAPLVTEGKTCIVLIQNGVGVEDPYRVRFPSNPIISAVTVVSAALVDPGTLVINAAFNPSAVLSGGRGNADSALDPELRRHLRGIMDEIFAAAPAVLGRPFPPELATPDKILTSNERNKGSKPSMLLDWEAGRPLELEVIVGNPVRIARARGVEMPRLQSVYALLRSMQELRDQEREREAQKKKTNGGLWAGKL
ncbi:2-dehydropantoate 2-reductase [Magnaporthiopsis poae ATCC 64411]|uniref:2-dehydropantoate 2-reductase n=1 Tax=Magnaporthiopsis poae (strain ATCC 64411 / 73-15) TaxID=644358 RepID=A0A0C4EEF4_MAGP6|nr:2-dehydropantoate 2-reductase [Magnaporthiopsis poae ATCC 64411]